MTQSNLLDNTQGSSVAISSAKQEKQAETHIKLLVRIRPTLASEAATQCIQLQKAALRKEKSPKSIQDQSQSSQSRKKTGVNGKAAKYEQKSASSAQTKDSHASVIKLTKGYNNISFKFD